MKRCKYCKKPGSFDPLLHKVLCKDHKDIYLNFRSVWQAIANMQMSPRERV